MAAILKVNKCDIEIVDLDHIQDIVVFENVKDIYPSDEDIRVCYCLGKEFVPTKRDWVGVFKTGWKTVQNYHAFKWAAQESEMDEVYRRRSVLFPGCLFQGNKQLENSYQFLYICKGDHVVGVSGEFSVVCSPTEEYLGLDLLESMYDSPELHADEQHPENMYDFPEHPAAKQHISKTVFLDTFDIVNDSEISVPVKSQNMKEKVLTIVKDHDSLTGDFSLPCWESSLHVVEMQPVVQEYVTDKERVPSDSPIHIFDITTNNKANMTASKLFRVVALPAIEYPTRLPITAGPRTAEAVRTMNVSYCQKCAVTKRVAAKYKKEIQQIEGQLELARAELKSSHVITVSSPKKTAVDNGINTEEKGSLQNVFFQQNKENKKMTKLQKDHLELRNKLASSVQKKNILRGQKMRLTCENVSMQEEVTQLQNAAPQYDTEADTEFSLNNRSGSISCKKDRLKNTITDQEKIIAELKEKLRVHNMSSRSQSSELNRLQKELKKERDMREKYQQKIDVMGGKMRSLLQETTQSMTNGWRQFAKQLHIKERYTTMSARGCEGWGHRDSNDLNAETQCTPPTVESAPPVHPRAFSMSNVPSQTSMQTSENTTISDQPKSAGFSVGIVHEKKDGVVAKIASSIQHLLGKCPTCGILFSSKAHRTAIEEHLLYHSRYD